VRRVGCRIGKLPFQATAPPLASGFAGKTVNKCRPAHDGGQCQKETL
jgi:hypothetical protein